MLLYLEFNLEQCRILALISCKREFPLESRVTVFSNIKHFLVNKRSFSNFRTHSVETCSGNENGEVVCLLTKNLTTVMMIRCDSTHKLRILLNTF